MNNLQGQNTVVGHHVGFLLHYKRNLKSLEEEMNNLQVQNTVVEGKVIQAKHRGEAVDDNVLLWLKDVDETRQGVDELMDEKTVKENMFCFNFSCPDFISRYRLSKQAEKKVVRIKHLAENGSKIGTISHPRENPPELELPSIMDYEDFHSRQKVFKGIVDALKDSNINMIGVYGTGGIGKTIMVEKVGKQLKEDGTFDEVVMAVVSKDANVINIQGQLGDRLNLRLSGETEVGRAGQLWNRLDNGKKNLIILDDVWQELDLTEIGIPIKAGNKRCKVVLTSQNRDVWKNMDVDVDFHVEFLTKEESWTLFKKKVGNHVDSHGEPRRDIAWAICNECQGLPVAINAIGATLKGKDLHAWKDAFHKLKNSMLKDIVGIDQKVYASLKWSYDQLASEDAKSCFLLCCLFVEDAEISIDDLVRYYMTWRTLHRYQMLVTLEQAFDQVCTVVDTLKSCCLLLDGKSKHLVKMHDVVRDIAISIAEDEKSFLVKHGFKDWPAKAAYEHCSVISLRLDDVRKFPDKLVCPELHTFRLGCSINRSPLEVPDEFFIGTGNLMVLDLTRVIMSPLLPASLAELAKLQMLCLNQCHLGDISILKDLKDHLEILSLQGSNIEVLPPEVGELTRLRLLDMSDCLQLRMIPKGVISKLFRLEELRMPMSFGKWEGTTDEREISNASLDELMSLTRLTTLQIWIPNAALLPKDLSLENLVRFEIIISKRFEYDPVRHFRHRVYTKPLTGILILENFHVANNLEFLLGKPKWSIPRNGLYPYLTDLSVRDCGMKYLFSPSCARELVGLQRLTIKHCGAMEGVIETEKDKDEDIPIIFSGLKLLNLKNLPNLISFYPEKGKTATSSGSSSDHAQTVLFNDKTCFPALESLEIESVEKITEIWDKQMLPIQEIATESPFCELSKLKIVSCEKLMNVVGGCPKLEAIATGHKQKGKEVDDYHVTRFPKLKILRLETLRNLESFCSRPLRCEVLLPLFDHQVIFPVLEELKISEVGNIIEIWDKQSIGLFEEQGSFCQLMNLDVCECNKLLHLFPPQMHLLLKNLKELEVGGCETMEGVVRFEEVDEDGLRNEQVCFNKLTSLNLLGLPKLVSFCTKMGEAGTTEGNPTIHAQPLFNGKVAFPALEHLQIWNTPSITEIWDKKPLSELEQEIESFSKLVTIDIYWCDQLVYVLPSYMLPPLQNLQKLKIRDCDEVEVIVLKELKEKEATDNDTIVFPQLKDVVFSGLPNLESFYTGTHLFSSKVTFPRLENLELDGCGSLRCIFQLSMARVLVNLQQLIIQDCSKMEAVVDGEEEIEDGQGRKSTDKTLFPHLSKLELRRLPELRWFCHFRYPLELPLLSKMVIEFCPKLNSFSSGSVSSSAHAQMALFNDKVILPGLEDLLVLALDRIEEIWDKQSPLVNQETVSFGQLKNMTVKSCRKLTNLFPSTILPRLQNLQTLLVDGCPNVEFVVFKNEKGEEQAADDSTLIIPQLRHLQMWNMEKLKSFYSSTTTSNAESLFNHQVTCPRLENLELEECESLRCIFQPSMAGVLVNLQELIINACPKMEAVFDGEEEIEDGQGRNSTDKILLPHLRKLELRRLPKLRRFCHFTCPIELPLLSRMVILVCPRMKSFSLGHVRTPNLALQEGGEIIAPPGLELASIMDWEDFHSRHKVFNGIVEALKDPEVNMIGIYGARGVGKTTMVDVVSERMEKDGIFDEVIKAVVSYDASERMEKDGIFDEVIKAVVSYDANVRKIQGQLADHLNLPLRGETKVFRAKQLWNRLDNEKKNLIILDDVWQELDLMEIGIPITDQNKRCKVVITSQNRDVLKNMDVHKDFKIEFLSEEEAWTLFKKVGNVDLNDQPLRDIAWAICKDCEGLPLAVKAFAAALRGKDMNAWQDALRKLNKSMLRDIEGINRWLYEPLRWSYDRLDYEDAKSCFLLCCLFSEDAEILVDGLVRYYMVWGTLDRKPDTLQRGLYRVRKLVDTLKSQGLLLDGNSEDTVKMHAVMRHVSTSIANNDESFFVDHHVKQWPAKATYEHCSVISLRPDDMRKFPNELVCPKLHTLRLDYTGNKSHAQVPDKFFSGMENLTILDLKRVTPPASLAKLVKLKMLSLEGCNLGDIAILKNLNDHLEILSLRGSNIEVLPSEVGELTRLRLLDMADCKELGMIPKGVISKLFLLEELHMPWNFRQWEGMTDERQINCVSLDELMALTRLTTLHIYIPDTALLLKDFTFENLVRFRISFGGEGFLGNWSLGDGALVLENIHIANALERLLGMQRNGLHPSTSFDHLTSLSFRDCRVKYLFSPSCARGLVQLKYLTVESCTVMEGVIGTEGEKDEDEVIIFKLLKYLRLEGLPNLMSFYHGKEKTATSSESSSAHARMVLFNDKVIFPTLEILELEGCESLRYIFQPSMPRGLVKLQELIINDCSKMEAVFDGEEEIDDGQGRKSTDKTPFPHLSKLELRHLPKLRWFCQFRYPLEMPLLSQMVMEVCPRLNSFSSGSVNSSAQAQMVLFNDKVTFPRLENLELDGCESLRCIFQLSMARVLVNLQQLIIHDCSKMEAVVDGEEEIEDGQGRKSTDKTLFPHLNKLELRRLPELRWFCHFRYPLELPLLSQMVIEVCPRLNSSSWGSVSSSAHAQMVLFNDQVTFPRLENLELEGCGSLKYIFQPSIARILVSLQELIINNCSKIVAVVGGEEQIEDGQGRESTDKTLFPHLSTLELRRLPELRRFCYFRYPLELPLLSQMVIEVCPRLNSIFFSSGSVSSSAHAQMVLFNDKVTFPRLENLEIEGCESLKYTFQPSMARVLVNLQKLIINDCSKLEAVVGREEEIEDGQGRKSTDKTLFPHLIKLELRRLPELRRFCHFRYPVELPLLSQMKIEDCRKLNSFSSGSVSTPNLFARFVSYDFVGDDTTVTEEEEPSKIG